MPKTLCLHIGWPKCASTSLQHMLYTNHRLLAELGVHYPIVSERPMGNAVPLVKAFLQDRFGPAIFDHFNPGLIPMEDRAGYVERTYLQTDHDTVVLSAEGLFRSVLENDYGFLFKPFDRIRVVWVIRPKLPWLQSHYFQGISTGRYKSEFAEELDGYGLSTRIDKMLAFMPVWQGWSQIAGPDNISVLLLGGRGPQIEHRFVEALLGQVPDGLELPPHKNSRLGIVAAAACAVQPETEDKVADAERLRLIKRTARRLGITASAPVIGPAELKSLSARFDADDRAFAEIAGLPLADLQPCLKSEASHATTLQAQRNTEDYKRLGAELAGQGISI